MVKMIRTMMVLGLIFLLLGTAVSGMENNNNDKDNDQDEDRDEDDHSDGSGYQTGDGEFSVVVTVLNEKDGSPVKEVHIYGWCEQVMSDREPQKVDGITDSNGVIAFMLDTGSFEFCIYKENYFESAFSLEVKGNMNHTANITPYPPESSTVKGDVTDAKTGEPMEKVFITFDLIESPLFPREPGQPEDPPKDDRPVDDDERREEEKKENSGSGSEGEGDQGSSTSSETNVDYYFFHIFKETSTDTKGHYTIDLIPGTYYVNVVPMWDDIIYKELEENEGHSSDDTWDDRGDNDEKKFPEYYPLTEKVTTRENETVWLNLSLKPLPPVNSMIKGYVNDEDGKGIAGAWIYVYPDGGQIESEEKPRDEEKKDEYDEGKRGDDGYEEVGEEGYVEEVYYPGYGRDFYGETDEKGYFEIDLRAGNYVIMVEPPYYGWVDEPGMEERPEEIVYDEGGKDEKGRGGEKEEGGSEQERPPEVDGNGDENILRTYKTEFDIKENEVKWLNVTLKGVPKKDGKIVGIVKDVDTGESVTNAEISLYGGEVFMYSAAEVDENGKFSIDVYPGYYYINVMIIHDRYYNTEEYEEKYGEEGTPKGEDMGGWYKVSTPYFPYSTELNVKAGETVEIEILLKPKPKDAVRIEGFVRDAETKSPLKYYPLDAMIITDEYVLDNSTYTDETGHYSIHVPIGDIILRTGGYYRYMEPVNSDGKEENENKENEKDRTVNKDYYPQKFITHAEAPERINKDFELEEKIIPADDTFMVTMGEDSGEKEGYVEIYVFDTERGVNYREYGFENEYKDAVENSDGGKTRGNEIGMRLPDGEYKAFASRNKNGAITGVSEISSFTISGGIMKNVGLSMKESGQNTGRMVMDFVSKEEVKVTTEVQLTGPSIITKATLENKVGDGNMEISASEKKLMERYTSITGEPIIRPVLSLSQVPFVTDDGSLDYRFGNMEGVIDGSPLDIEIAFTMSAVGKIDLDKDASFDLNIKGPFSMDVDCEITLPKEMELEDGTRTVKKTMKIKAGNVWREGLSEDFDEQKGASVPSDYSAESDDDGSNDANIGGDSELGADEGLKLTVFSAETDNERKSIMSEPTYVIAAAAVMIALLFIVLFLVVWKKRERPPANDAADEEAEEIEEKPAPRRRPPARPRKPPVRRAEQR